MAANSRGVSVFAATASTISFTHEGKISFGKAGSVTSSNETGSGKLSDISVADVDRSAPIFGSGKCVLRCVPLPGVKGFRSFPASELHALPPQLLVVSLKTMRWAKAE